MDKNMLVAVSKDVCINPSDGRSEKPGEQGVLTKVKISIVWGVGSIQIMILIRYFLCSKLSREEDL